MAQARITKRPRPAEESPVDSSATGVDHVTTEAIDEMLDEIDAVLESNAEEFLKGYIQKGGE